MATCRFCERNFKSSQGVRAHLKHCGRYRTQRGKGSGALGRQPRHPQPRATDQWTDSRPVASGPQVAQAAPLALLTEQIQTMVKASTDKAPESPAQRRRTLLQEAKIKAIDLHVYSKGTVTTQMRGAAKAAIEHELSGISLEELPVPEVCELAAAIRDRIYEPFFRKEHEEAERRQAEQGERRGEQARQQTEEQRQAKRKIRLMLEAGNLASARCRAYGLSPRDRLSIEVEVHARVREALTGAEPLPEAYALIEKIIAFRLAEEEAKLAAERARQWQEWRGLLLLAAAVIGLILLVRWFPGVVLAILDWLERTFGINQPNQPGPGPGKASGTDQAARGTAKTFPFRRRGPRPAPQTNSQAGPRPGSEGLRETFRPSWPGEQGAETPEPPGTMDAQGHGWPPFSQPT